MKFTQRYSVTEYGFGTQWISVIVSDTYSDILNNTLSNPTDVITVDTGKKDLNISEGEFAVDELSFGINLLSCRTEADQQCLEFCKQAANINNHRYIAVFMGDITSKTSSEMLEMMDFFGRIDSKISGDDLVWSSDNHESTALPKRDYKFSAYSFDISILEQCKIKGTIQKADGTTVPSISAHFGYEGDVRYDGDFNIKDIFAYDTGKVCKAFPTGTLWSVLQQYLWAARLVILDLTSTDVSFTLLDSDTGIDVSPVKITPKNYTAQIDKIENDYSRKLRLKIAQNTTGTGWVSAQIFRTMLNTELGHNMDDLENFQAWETEAVTQQNSKCFHGQSDVAAILYEVAKAFGMYVFAKQTAANAFTIEFKSLGNIAESDYTYITGVSDAGLDTSSALSKEATQYYSTANSLAMDGYDNFSQVYDKREVDPSRAYDDFKTRINEETNKKKIKSERLILSTGPTLYTMHYSDPPTKSGVVNFIKTYLHNSSCSDTTLTWTDNCIGEGRGANGLYEGFMPELLNNGLLIKTTPSSTETMSLSVLGVDGEVIKPIGAVYAKVGAENREFKSLSEYVNAVSGRSLQYYETEYKMTVPFWNGFSKTTDRALKSYKNIKLGSKIKVKETIKTLTDGVWADSEVETDFIVVGIERNYQTPETQLTLQSSERFDYFQYNGTTDPSFAKTNLLTDITSDNTIIEELEADTGVTFEVGDAVAKLASGLVVRATAHNSHYGKIIGLCKGQSGSTVQVQTSGRFVQNAYDFTVGSPVFVRTNASGLNVSQTFLTAPDADEDMIAFLGHADTADSFFIEIHNYIYS